jgi:hypothetical protein
MLLRKIKDRVFTAWGKRDDSHQIFDQNKRKFRNRLKIFRFRNTELCELLCIKCVGVTDLAASLLAASPPEPPPRTIISYW